MFVWNKFAMVAALAAAAFSGWVLLERQQPPRRPAAVTTPGYVDPLGIDKLTSVTILNFYAYPGQLTEGEHSVLCYGVAKARSVRLDPPVDRVSPSLNRCLSVAPEVETRYTLTAEGEDGRTVSESFVLQVQPDPRRLPAVTSFTEKRAANDRGLGVHLLCFTVKNAESVRVEPRLFPAMVGSPSGCFYVAPRETTTYTLIAAGRHGRTAKRDLTVAVP